MLHEKSNGDFKYYITTKKIYEDFLDSEDVAEFLKLNNLIWDYTKDGNYYLFAKSNSNRIAGESLKMVLKIVGDKITCCQFDILEKIHTFAKEQNVETLLNDFKWILTTDDLSGVSF